MVSDYRDDDVRARGWCPYCSALVAQSTTDGRGYCDDHGWVWIEFKSGQRVELDDEGPIEPHRRMSVGDVFPTMRDVVVDAANGDVWPRGGEDG